MNLPRYDSYTHSNILWVGKFPSHWSITQVKYEAYVKARVGWHGLKSDDFTDEGPYLVTGSDFKSSSIRWQDCYHCDLKRYEQDPYIQLSNGDLLITKDGTIGKVALVQGLNIDDKATLNSGVFVVRPLRNNFSTKYYYWLLQSKVFTDFVDSNKTGSTIVHLYQDTFVNFSYASPKIQDQIQISAFLDHETAKIDNLIEKQQQLIELLKEKRQAVISHAVTKGLNPDVPMKDSGVEWLGDVPEHWEVSKFGYISLVVRGGSPRPAGDPTLFNGDYSPWVTVAEITKDNEIYLESTDTFLTKKGSEQCRVFKAGTLVLSNSGATLGVPKILKMDANANDGVVGFESLRIDHEYAYFYLSTLTNNLRESIKQGSGQPNLNTDIVKSIAVPIPPENEMQFITSSIKKYIELYALIESSALEQVKLLQERRTALISAAVTGKIDVRDWVAPDTSDIEASEEATA